MKSLFLQILISFLLTGCASGKFSMSEGTAKFSIPFDFPKFQKQPIKYMDLVYVGMPKEDLYDIFDKALEKKYYREDNEEWITFSSPVTEEPDDVVIFHLVDGKVKGWKEVKEQFK